jgi:hypothetical protein
VNSDVSLIKDKCRKNGYFTYQLLGEDELNILNQLYSEYDPDIPESFYCSNWIADKRSRYLTHEKIQAVMSGKLSSIMPGYRMLYSCFITKRRSWGGKIYPHIDWQFVEEPDAAAFNVWMPLKRTGRLNGGMWVVPGSHQYTNAKRGPNIELPIPEKWLQNKKQIKLNAGEALVYDTRLIHGSFPNLVPGKRIALASILVPSNVPVIHHFKDPVDDKIHTFSVDDSFYLERCDFKKVGKHWMISPGL